MSIWGDIASVALPVATTGLGFALGGPVGAAAGAALGGGIETNLTNQQNVAATNATNAQIAQSNNALSLYMSNTAYQRQTADMEAAGLNPILAAGTGGGASVPGLATPSMQAFQAQNPVSPAVSSALSAISAVQNVQKTAADTRLTNAQANVAENYTPSQVQAQTQETLGRWGVDIAQRKQADSQTALNTAELPLEQAKAKLGSVASDGVSYWLDQIRSAAQKAGSNSAYGFLQSTPPTNWNLGIGSGGP